MAVIRAGAAGAGAGPGIARGDGDPSGAHPGRAVAAGIAAAMLRPVSYTHLISEKVSIFLLPLR